MTACTCLIGRTLPAERLQQLDAALRGGSGTLGALATAYGVTKPTLGRHRLECLGLERQHGGRFQERGATPATPRDEGETSHETAGETRDGPPRAHAEPSEVRAVAAPETSRETAPPIDPAALAVADPAALGVHGFAEQVSYIADMITRGAWKDRRSVTALCAAWGLGRDAIHERHRAGVVLASADRGAMAEQLENTIGLVTAGAEECEAQAYALEHPTSEDGKPIGASEDARALALKYRALGAKNRGTRMRLEGLLVSRVSVSIEGDPRLAGFFPVLWEACAEIDAAMRAYVADVGRLSGGVVPSLELPSAADVVRAAVVAYEARTGGRAALGMGGGG